MMGASEMHLDQQTFLHGSHGFLSWDWDLRVEKLLDGVNLILGDVFKLRMWCPCSDVDETGR